MQMNKKETLRLLDKYTDAFKARAEAEDKLSKVDQEFKIDASMFAVPYTKFLVPFITVFMVIALAIRIAIRGNLKYNNELPITIGIFASAAIITVVPTNPPPAACGENADSQMRQMACQRNSLLMMRM